MNMFKAAIIGLVAGAITAGAITLFLHQLFTTVGAAVAIGVRFI